MSAITMELANVPTNAAPTVTPAILEHAAPCRRLVEAGLGLARDFSLVRLWERSGRRGLLGEGAAGILRGREGVYHHVEVLDGASAEASIHDVVESGFAEQAARCDVVEAGERGSRLVAGWAGMGDRVEVLS